MADIVTRQVGGPAMQQPSHFTFWGDMIERPSAAFFKQCFEDKTAVHWT